MQYLHLQTKYKHGITYLIEYNILGYRMIHILLEITL